MNNLLRMLLAFFQTQNNEFWLILTEMSCVIGMLMKRCSSSSNLPFLKPALLSSLIFIIASVSVVLTSHHRFVLFCVLVPVPWKHRG